MKKLIQLTLLLLALLLPATATAYSFTANGIYYIITGTNKVSVTYKRAYYQDEDDDDLTYVNDYSGHVSIPSTVTYNGTTYSVTSISDNAFHSSGQLTSVYIPTSVTTIGEEAFCYCNHLEDITIPNSITSIGNGAFYGCENLSHVYITDLEAWCKISFDYPTWDYGWSSYYANPLFYAHHLYLNGQEIKDLVIPNTITTIKKEAFRGCSGLTSVTIPSSVTGIASGAFAGCSGLTKVNISSVEAWCNITINSNPLSYAHHLYCNGVEIKNLTIPNSVTAIKDNAFNGCSEITSLYIPSSVQSIGATAFEGCNNLSSITVSSSNTYFDSRNDCNAIIYSYSNSLILGCQNTSIPNSVTTIGSSAFKNCNGLTSITIPNSVTSIGSDAFYGCTGIKYLTWNATYCSSTGSMTTSNIESVTIGNEVRTLPGSFVSGSKITSVTIPNSVTSIGSNAFRNCTGLTSVTIPNSVTSIGVQAFEGCNGLTSITIPNSVTTIGGNAFSGCSGITSLTIPNSVMSIGNSAFKGCSGLIDVTIGSSVTSIGNYAFQGCSSLETLNYNAINCNDFSSTNSYLPFYNLNISTIIIGDSVQRIPAYFANGLLQLDSVVLSSSVSSVGCYSFDNTGWYNRQPDGVVYLGEFTYNYKGTMPDGTSITLKNGILGIADYAFYGKTKLTGITIPNTITSIGTSAFKGCSNIRDLVWNAINCSSMGDMPKTNIKQVKIGNQVESLPSDFVRGSKITKVVIPNSVKAISNAFENCSALHDITIGKGVTTINSNAFNGCDIKTLRYNAVNCNSIAADAFNADLILSSLQFGDSVRYIPAGLPTFEMTGANLLIPNSVQSIASGALSSGVCDAVVIGNSLNGLEAGTFSEGIKVAYVSNAEPIPSAPAAFADPQTLYVPGGSKVKYWTAQGWNEFKEIIQGPYIPVDALAIDSVISMPKGSTRQLAATISPTDATATSIKWFSKDETIATVDNNGVIQAIDHGETDIYAVVDTVMAICHVNVNVALVEALTLNATQLLLEPDDIFTLIATANPDYAENKAVEWEIPENDVIVHFINGNSINIGTLQEGTVTVTAHAVDGSNLTASCVITVQQDIVHATSVELNQTSAGLNEGETLQLTATVMPEDATDKSVIWATSDATVATVDQNGLVTAVAPGTATITASTVDGSELTASCEVTVNGLTYNNSLDADALTVYCGDEKQLAIRMNNESSITAVQCDIYLPDGISIATEDGDYLIDLVPARKASNHVVSTNDLPNGAIRLFITSATSKPFKGNEGDLFVLNLVVADDAESGDYSLDFRNVILSDTEAHPYYAPDLNVPVSIRDYIKGDVNSDRTVNVADYVATANYILELDPHPFLFAAADIDENGTVNVSDLVGVANIALSFMGAPVYTAPAMRLGGSMMGMTYNCTSTAAGRHVVTIDLNNSDAVTAFQMDVTLPTGMTLTNASLTGRASASHTLEMTELSNGAYRLLGASMMSKAFSGNEGALLTLEIEGASDGTALIDGIMLAEPNTALHELDAMTLSFGQSGMTEIGSGLRIYVESGMVVVESPAATTVQFILTNGMSVTRDVKVGRNVYNTGLEGVVIVKAGDQVKKLKL